MIKRTQTIVTTISRISFTKRTEDSGNLVHTDKFMHNLALEGIQVGWEDTRNLLPKIDGQDREYGNARDSTKRAHCTLVYYRLRRLTIIELHLNSVCERKGQETWIFRCTLFKSQDTIQNHYPEPMSVQQDASRF